MDEPDAVFFGCYDEAGHLPYTPDGHLLSYLVFQRIIPWSRVDGALAPADDTGQGAAAVHHKNGWTALAFHDYTVDDRPGSNGVVFLRGELDNTEVFAAAVAAFPSVMARVGDVRLVPV